MINIFALFKQTVLVIFVLLLTWLALWLKGRIIRRYQQKRLKNKRPFDPFTLHILQKIGSIVIAFLSVMLLMQIFGLDIVPILTLSGIGAAVIGFASKDVVSNFFGGLTIYMTRPFSVEDFIELPQRRLTGIVEEIGWYITAVRDPHKKMQYIPNALFSTEIVVNYSRMTHRRIEELVRLRNMDEKEAKTLVEDLKKYVEVHPEIDQNESIDISIASVSSWGLGLEIKAYTKPTGYGAFMRVKQDVLLKLHELAFFRR